MFREITVTSNLNPLAYIKAIATLVGTIATGLLGIYAADTEVGKILTIAVIIATAIATYTFLNAVVVPGEVVDEEIDDSEDDDLSYEEAGGVDFPTEHDESVLYGDGADRGAEGSRDSHRY